MRSTTRLGRWSTGGAALLLAVSLAACGSDDDSGSDTEATETSAAETTEAEGGDADAFCAAAVEAETTIGQGPPVDFEAATPEEIEAALAEFSQDLEPTLEELESVAPEEISSDVESLSGQVRQALETGDDSVFESEEFVSADAAIDEYMLDNCGFEQIEATGVDYEYEGIPDTVPAGTVAVTFDNQGEEVHEIGIVRINDDVTASVEELLAMPEDQVMSMITFTGVAFANPGESDTTFLRLEPGRYAAACFVPEGTTHDTEGGGPPHFTLGMFAEFTAE
ncbi:hypothetical protein [Candidatus Blastococcus massiliensis]|uniref:hypothetical protein n=1 Tax=Candidatus Blastococcus massiliensis TaxID=1470358 RepID=UPI0004B3780F|nr:hypothetical protein [Candidatus Blastococcus massiliensis]